jgi:thioredoxin 2
MIMATPAIVACTNCGRKNRSAVAARGVPRCAVCHEPLPWIVDADAHEFAAAIDADVPVLVDFWAEWCAPCRMIVERLGREPAGRLKVVKLDVDEAPDVAARYGAQSIPLLMLSRDGEEADRLVGAAPEPQLCQWLEPPPSRRARRVELTVELVVRGEDVVVHRRDDRRIGLLFPPGSVLANERDTMCISEFNRVRIIVANPQHAGITEAERRLAAKLDAVVGGV